MVLDKICTLCLLRTLELFSYGSPIGNVISGKSAINPRQPGGGTTLYSASGDTTRASALNQNPFVATSGTPAYNTAPPLVPDKVTLSGEGYG